jgi:hypothetical protein
MNQRLVFATLPISLTFACTDATFKLTLDQSPRVWLGSATAGANAIADLSLMAPLSPKDIVYAQCQKFSETEINALPDDLISLHNSITSRSKPYSSATLAKWITQPANTKATIVSYLREGKDINLQGKLSGTPVALASFTAEYTEESMTLFVAQATHRLQLLPAAQDCIAEVVCRKKHQDQNWSEAIVTEAIFGASLGVNLTSAQVRSTAGAQAVSSNVSIEVKTSLSTSNINIVSTILGGLEIPANPEARRQFIRTKSSFDIADIVSGLDDKKIASTAAKFYALTDEDALVSFGYRTVNAEMCKDFK